MLQLMAVMGRLLIAIAAAASHAPGLRGAELTVGPFMAAAGHAHQLQSSPPAAGGGPPPPPPAVNPLKGLPGLPKYHYSWPIGPEYIDAGRYDGLIIDYARITGSLAAQGGAANATQMLAAVDVCDRAGKMPNTTRTPGIGLNYGCLPGASASGVGPGTGCNETCEAAGIAEFTAELAVGGTVILLYPL
jgi:hypothetical protein